jgi:DNA ligase-1
MGRAIELKATAIRSALLVSLGGFCSPGLGLSEGAVGPPPLMLANIFEEENVDVREYWISEKFDGVRAYWNGERLLTRAGHVIHAPDWFVGGWPKEALDGELWIGRGQFEVLLSTVRDETPDDDAWRQVRFQVFDLPGRAVPFSERLAALGDLLRSLDRSWVQPANQWRVADQNALEAHLDRIIAAGGEGLMLHRDTSLYHAKRSNDLLKLKPYKDAEAQVIGHVPGNGKYQGMLGALEVKDSSGQTFRIGTGFSDEQRAAPPPIGAWVTYRYRGLTTNGVPRFASFVRVRD